MMHTFVPKQKQSHRTKSASSKTQGRGISVQNHAGHPILHLQRTLGNQAVQRSLQPNAEEHEEGLSIKSTSSRFAHDFRKIPI